MAAREFGTIHLYGIGTAVANATITDASFEDVMANMASVEDEIGNVIEERGDDLTTTGTVTLIIQEDYAVPEPYTVFVYDGESYLITRIGQKATSRGFNIVEVGVKLSQEMTYD